MGARLIPEESLWTEEELAIALDSSLSASEVAALTGRSIRGVYTKRSRMGMAQESWRPSPRIERTIMELRERGLEYKAIATVLDLYEGEAVTPHQVKYRVASLRS